MAIAVVACSARTARSTLRRSGGPARQERPEDQGSQGPAERLGRPERQHGLAPILLATTRRAGPPGSRVRLSGVSGPSHSGTVSWGHHRPDPRPEDLWMNPNDHADPPFRHRRPGPRPAAAHPAGEPAGRHPRLPGRPRPGPPGRPHRASRSAGPPPPSRSSRRSRPAPRIPPPRPRPPSRPPARRPGSRRPRRAVAPSGRSSALRSSRP
jgi:hypothetical protein